MKWSLPALLLFAVSQLTIAVCIAQTAETANADTGIRWTESAPVRDESDSVHLNWKKLRVWQTYDIPQPPAEKTLNAAFVPLWKSALESDDRELRRNALVAIADAHSGGYRDFSELTNSVKSVFVLDDLSTKARIDAARTLTILDAKTAAPDIQKYLEEAPELRRIAEAAFARWKYRGIRSEWMDRVKSPDAFPQTYVVLALRGLAEAGSAEAVDPIQRIVSGSEFKPAIRVEAARALAQLRQSGLEETSERLLASTSRQPLVPALLAATLLRLHKGDVTETLLLRIIERKSPTAVALAWKRLNELNPDRVSTTSILKALTNRDALVRLEAVRTCGIRDQPLIEQLVERLDDHHPDVRCQARHLLRDLATTDNAKLAKDVRDTLHEALQANSWRGLEQAALLVAELDHKPSGKRLVELLSHQRDEVGSASAYALKELGIPELLPELFEHSRLVAAGGFSFRRIETVQPHLFETFGTLKFKAAHTFMKDAYVPKSSKHFHEAQSRSTAIWALASMNEGPPDAELVTDFSARMLDRSELEQELIQVQAAAALGLGIMKAKSAIGGLRQQVKDFSRGDLAGAAAWWALNLLTGEPVPPLTPIKVERGRWFLTPLPADMK